MHETAHGDRAIFFNGTPFLLLLVIPYYLFDAVDFYESMQEFTEQMPRETL